ncbi:MAG: creatininase family protein [Lachnospiraceae bacterium]|jgi:creatinine amidohydrolase/Fe(II)-dependent formamide hydrolase-like protein|nr:creatininase family protein [Lachnospiraceae bacterium]MDY6222270.1 3-dehydro-scyllo-inosose hydrolase [Candidatus Alectryocaccobium sp.]
MSKWEIPMKGGNMEVNNGIYFQNMTNLDVAERLKKNDVIMIPIGSTENHGPSGPYGEDTYLETRMCEQVALKTGCTVAQPIWYGSHPYQHLGMPGTIVIPEEILANYLMYVMAGFWNAGFRKMILVNGHGQDYVIPLAMHKFAKKWQVPLIAVYPHLWHIGKEYLADKEHGGVYDKHLTHACEVEQSWSMCMFPDLCRIEDAVETQGCGLFPPGYVDFADELGVGGKLKWYNLVGNVAMEVIATPEGVIGNPKKASVEKGRAGCEAAMDYLEKLVNDIIEKYPAGTLPPIDKVTMRPKEQIEAVIKGPTNGGTHLYTLGYE